MTNWTPDELGAIGAADEDAIDAAYRGKYGRYGRSYLDPMLAPTARATTLRLNAA